jgi:hypothetical protein
MSLVRIIGERPPLMASGSSCVAAKTAAPVRAPELGTSPARGQASARHHLRRLVAALQNYLPVALFNRPSPVPQSRSS